MNYRRNKNSTKKFILITVTIVIALFLVTSVPAIGGFFKSATLKTGKVFWGAKNSWVSAVSEKMSDKDMEEYKRIQLENKVLKQRLDNLNDLIGSMPSNEEPIMSAVLLRPGQSPYDTLVIEGGRDIGINIGDIVFADDFAALGTVGEVFGDTSRVTLFSSYNSKNQVIVGPANVSLEALGQGGQNIKIDVPEGIVIQKGDTAMLPLFQDALVGVVEEIIFEKGETIKTLLVRSPVNMQQLRFVFVVNKKENGN